MVKTNEDFEPICQTTFTERLTGRKLIARLGAPLFDPEKGEYYCINEIEGLKEGYRERRYCDTSFEALLFSLLRFRTLFGNLAGDFRDDTGSAPYTLFPKEIPWVYGKDVYDSLRATVDAEVQKIEDDLTRRREADPDGDKGH